VAVPYRWSDRHDERDFVGPSAPTLSAVEFAHLAAHHGIVHLDAAIEFTVFLIGLHDGVQLLALGPRRKVYSVGLIVRIWG